jgi:hypothetical protein
LELIALGVLLVVSNFTRRARYANSVGDTNRFNLALRLGLRICSMDCRVRNGIPEWYPGRDQGHRTQNRARARRRIATSQAERPNSWQSGTSEVHRLASAQVNRGRLKVLPGCKGEPNMAARANWKGVLKVGEVSCPVALYTAASTAERITFHILNRKTGHRVHREFVDAETGKRVAEGIDQRI